jgi:hypothetical protein
VVTHAPSSIAYVVDRGKRAPRSPLCPAGAEGGSPCCPRAGTRGFCTAACAWNQRPHQPDGPAAVPGRRVAGQLGGSGGVRDRDLARLGLLSHREAERQHAVGVGGLDVVQVQAVAERQLADERTGRPLLSQPFHVITAWRALGAHGEGPAVDADVDRARVGTRQVALQHVVVTGAADIHRHRPNRLAHVGRRAEHPLGQAVEVAERVETGHHHNHLLEVYLCRGRFGRRHLRSSTLDVRVPVLQV